MAKKLFYKIGDACKALDIQPYVLRYWEREFPFLAPGKSSGGQRVYSVEELEVVRRIKVLLYEEGYTIAGAKRRIESELQDGSVAAAAADAAPVATKAKAADAVAKRPRLLEPSAPVADEVGDESELDSGSSEKVETLLAGVRDALGRSREILRILESKVG